MSSDKINYMFIGSVLPSKLLGEFELGQSATIQTQGSLVNAMIEAGNTPDMILTTLPVQRFPLEAFQPIGHEASAYLEEGEGAKSRVEFLGYNNLEPFKSLSIGIEGFWKLYRWAKRVRANGEKPVALMYNLGPTHHLAPFFVLAAKLSGAKLVSLVTDLEPRQFSIKGLVGWLSYKLQCWSLKQMDGLMPLNENVVKDLDYQKPWQQVFGILPNDAFARSLAELPIASMDKPSFLFSGSLNPVRGVDLLVRAFMSWDQPDAKLIITGRGDLAEWIRARALEDQRIDFRGFLPNEEDLIETYKEAHFVVNPHRMDHAGARYVFPSKLTEYMASGRYVISSNQGEIQSEYGELMSIYLKDREEDLREKLEEAWHLSSATKVQHTNSARKRVLEQQLWKHHCQRLTQFLSQYDL